MSVAFLSLLLIFEQIQQIALVNFILYLNIHKILKISFGTFWIKNYIYLVLYACKTAQWKQPRLVKPWFFFFSKFHIDNLWCSFSRENNFLLTLSQSFPRQQENVSSNASRYINNSLGVYLFLNSDLNNRGMKV